MATGKIPYILQQVPRFSLFLFFFSLFLLLKILFLFLFCCWKPIFQSIKWLWNQPGGSLALSRHNTTSNLPASNEKNEMKINKAHSLKTQKPYTDPVLFCNSVLYYMCIRFVIYRYMFLLLFIVFTNNIVFTF